MSSNEEKIKFTMSFNEETIKFAMSLNQEIIKYIVCRNHRRRDSPHTSGTPPWQRVDVNLPREGDNQIYYALIDFPSTTAGGTHPTRQTLRRE